MSAVVDFANNQPTDQHPDVRIGPPPPRRRRRRRARPARPRRASHALSSDIAPTDVGSSFGLSDSDAQSSARVDSSFACDGYECESSGMFSYNHSCIESSEDEIDLESGGLDVKLRCFSGKFEKICRICHLNFGDQAEEEEDGGGSGGDGGGGGEIELGCSCKGDLGTAHKQCAETWFKIKGNMICEICGAAAQNVGGEQANEASQAAAEMEPADRSVIGPVMIPTEPRTFWQGRRIMNILLGCMVFAFIISWLFHFHVLP